MRFNHYTPKFSQIEKIILKHIPLGLVCLVAAVGLLAIIAMIGIFFGIHPIYILAIFIVIGGILIFS